MRFGRGSGAEDEGRRGGKIIKIKEGIRLNIDMQGEGGKSCIAGRVWAWDKPD